VLSIGRWSSVGLGAAGRATLSPELLSGGGVLGAPVAELELPVVPLIPRSVRFFGLVALESRSLEGGMSSEVLGGVRVRWRLLTPVRACEPSRCRFTFSWSLWPA